MTDATRQEPGAPKVGGERSPGAAWRPTFWRATGIVAFGCLLAAAFPPAGQYALAWFALVPLLLVCRFTSPPRKIFAWGFSAGFLFWAVTLIWLLRLGDTGAPWAAAVLGWLALSAACAAFMGTFSVMASFLFHWTEQRWPPAEAPEPPPSSADEIAIRLHQLERDVVWSPEEFLRNGVMLLSLPVLWVGFEYLRGNLLTGFPWNAIGVTQWQNVRMIQGAEWGGVYAVSAIVVFLNVLFATTALRFVDSYLYRRPRPKFRLEMFLVMIVCALYWMHGKRVIREDAACVVTGPIVCVAAVQPNIPQLKKWNPDFPREICEQLARQTELAASVKPDLTIWPETAVPAPVNMDPDVAAFVREVARKTGPLLVGTLEEKEGSSLEDPVLFNSAFLYDGNGEVIDIYRKLHLVPFGEYLPLDDKVDFIRRLAPLGFSCTPGKEMTVFRLPPSGVTFSTLICFEDIFPSLARRAVAQGAGFLVNQTNDGWFDDSAGAMQHLSQAVFRCVENRVSMVRAANTGVSAIIDRCGRTSVLQNGKGGTKLAGFKPGVIEVRAAGAPLTFYTRYGDFPFALPCGVVAGVSFLLVMLRGNVRMRTHEAKESQSS